MSYIKNRDRLLSHGNVKMRQAALEIIEYALEQTALYKAVQSLVRLDGSQMTVGKPQTGPAARRCSGRNTVHSWRSGSRVGYTHYVVQAGTGIVKITRSMFYKFYPSFISIYGYMVSGVRCQDSTPGCLCPDTWNLVEVGMKMRSKFKSVKVYLRVTFHYHRQKY